VNVQAARGMAARIMLKCRALLGLVVLLAAFAERASGQAAAIDPPAQRADESVMVHFDPAIAQRLSQQEAEHRKAREVGLKDPKAWAEQRGQRAAQHRAEIGQVWGALVDGPDAQARLRIHADRMARLNRMLDLAEHAHDSALAARLHKDIELAIVTHAQDMQTVRAALGMK
jgi:hypothetical protein